ncbi:hypothetical protein RFI_36672 [Reticulomyxa filosa]|uniref:Uncharacterized protein n=1 Tax=Reticulomyxa filosa TaxID=46433 RepID=X6LFJ3_RETFI|nr:hypothetical protein RFI_36672 [Reticulomyxa filosa]|eukprot:ETO00768.1 hypothetical protein RFI_36672 [Reticulomyxa filosa]
MTKKIKDDVLVFMAGAMTTYQWPYFKQKVNTFFQLSFVYSFDVQRINNSLCAFVQNRLAVMKKKNKRGKSNLSPKGEKDVCFFLFFLNIYSFSVCFDIVIPIQIEFPRKTIFLFIYFFIFIFVVPPSPNKDFVSVMFVFCLLFKKLQNNFVCIRHVDQIQLFCFKGGFENDGKKLNGKGGGNGKKDDKKNATIMKKKVYKKKKGYEKEKKKRNRK